MPITTIVFKQTPGKTCYSQFKSCIVKKLAFQIPVASSPIATRWQQACTRSQPEQSFTECHPPELSTLDDASDLTGSAEKITTIPGPSNMLCKATVSEITVDTNTTCLHERSKSRKQAFTPLENKDGISEKGGMRICEKHKCLWKGIQVNFSLCS
ncbi:hypothetical protein lerEdw1_000453 [Lerista edwardsae]|nr:hypothetical protein lerEdw1_000453 [Lerista edwardsae]